MATEVDRGSLEEVKHARQQPYPHPKWKLTTPLLYDGECDVDPTHYPEAELSLI